MKLLAHIAIFIGFSLLGFSQNTFPESWVGNYKGELEVYGIDSVRMKALMELKIDKTKNDSVFSWTIIYDFKGKKDIRSYKLIIVDRKKGLYKIDEKNSIEIEAYLHNNHILTSFFKVSESFIIASYIKEDENLIFEIISSKSEVVSISGNTKKGDESIPEVSSYLINGRQKAVLEKQKSF